MARRPFATHRPRPLACAQAWALALLLLVTQQWGWVHGVSHLSGGRESADVIAQRAVVDARAWGAGDASAHGVPAADEGRALAAEPATGLDTTADPAADALCSTCLVLATIGALAPPHALAWGATQAPAATPAALAAATPRAARAAPFQARAPPSLPASA